MKKNDDIDNNILKRLQEQKMQKEIAEELGLTPSTISYRIKKMRERGVSIPILKNRKGRPKKVQNDDIDNNILKGLQEQKMQKEIAEELGLPPRTISKRIKKMRERGVSIPKKIQKFQNEDIDNNILKGLQEQKIQKEIAEELGLTQSTISYRIKKMRERGVSIPIFKNRKSRPKKVQNDDIDNNILKGLQEQKMQKEIAEELGLTPSTISFRIKQMRKRGISIPKTLEKTEIYEEDVKIIRDLTEGLKQTEIAKKRGVSKQSINQRKKRIDKIPPAKMIASLKYTKHATNEQIKVIGEYYGVDVEEILKSLDEQER